MLALRLENQSPHPVTYRIGVGNSRLETRRLPSGGIGYLANLYLTDPVAQPSFPFAGDVACPANPRNRATVYIPGGSYFSGRLLIEAAEIDPADPPPHREF